MRQWKRRVFVFSCLFLILALSDCGNQSLTPTLPTTPTATALKPAEFTVGDPVISPAEIEVWREATVTTLITNIGDIKGTYTATFKINGKSTESKDVVLEGGESEMVTFTFFRDTGPECDIDICGITRTLPIKEGALPLLCIGDKWTAKFIEEENEYEGKIEIIGDDIINSKACYIIQFIYDPSIRGIFSSSNASYEKTTMDVISTVTIGEYEGFPIKLEEDYSYEYTGDWQYPRYVGQEFTVVETAAITMDLVDGTSTDTRINTYIVKVEGFEDITVPAGTFRCFKISRYNESGDCITTKWASDKVKGYAVKVINYEDGSDVELISYSVNTPGES